MNSHTTTPNQRARSRRAEALFAAAIAVVALIAFGITQAVAASADGAPVIATIARNGTVIETVDLADVAEPYTLRLEDASGTNVVEVEPGRIRVMEADCPDKVCVDMGWVEAPGRPIACVPHGLTITLEREGGAPDAVDAIAG